MNKFPCFTVTDMNFSHKINETIPTTLEMSHCHDFYEILFVTEGKGKFILEGAEIPLCPGLLVIARPLEYHCVKIDAGSTYERYVIHFGVGAVLPEVTSLFEETLASGNGANMYSTYSLTDSVVTLFERFRIVESLPEEKRLVFAKLLFSELITLLSVTAGESRSIDDGELGARVIKFLNENVEKNISLDKIAKRFFVSKYYLCRAFKKHNGISVHGYINKKRVMLAKQMIESGETASGAAYRVGFGDYSAFYRAYMKVLGEAPTQRSQRSEDEVNSDGV